MASTRRIDQNVHLQQKTHRHHESQLLYLQRKCRAESIFAKRIILVEGYEVTKETLALSPLENKSMNNDDVDSDEKHSDKNSDVSANYH